jgi:deoxyadenosine/deoxycytidine kinase
MNSQKTTNTPPHFVVEGNIGAGKSTFLRIIEEKLHIDVVYEPTDKWNVGQKDNPLDLFYKDTKRWAYTFQTYAFITRVQAQLEHMRSIDTTKPQVYERSVYCDRFCFAKNCFEMGTMTEMEWSIYKEWFSWLVESYTAKPSGFIYLRTTPDVCYERIQKRSRCEESSVPKSYLELLHNKHEDWLVHGHDQLEWLADIPVLTLDCDSEFEVDAAEQQHHLDQLELFINQVTKPVVSAPEPSAPTLTL